MNRLAIVTDTNSGIGEKEAQEFDIFILPMPFIIDGQDYLEGIDLTYEQFHEKQINGADIRTSQPSVGSVMELWDKILLDYNEILHIPMSSSLSSSYETAAMLAEDYNGSVHVVNNQRISITQKASVLDAVELRKAGKNALEIKKYLEKAKFDSSIYITVETLTYLKKGGRITPTAAAIGEFLKIKPVLQIQGGKLDAFSKARTKKQAKKIMIQAMKEDIEKRFLLPADGQGINLMIAHSTTEEEINDFLEELKAEYPNHSITVDRLSLSVICHIGPGAIGYGASKKISL